MSSSSVGNHSKTVVANLSVSGHVLNTSCVKWSEDNCIAITVDKHICILSSRTDPTEVGHQFPYHKSLIPNPDKSMNFDCGLDLKTVLSVSSSDEKQILMCDPTLAGETNNSSTFRSYRRVEWSPICRECGCLLAALTLDHRLAIHRKSGNGWQPITDLSLVLNEKLKEFWTDIDTTPDYHIYKNRIYSLATNAFCWAQNWSLRTDSISCRLFLGSKNGLITFWDFNIGYNFKTDVQLVYKWETTYDQINCLKSFDNFLVMSSINGTVCVIFTEFSLNSSPNPLSLWSEADNILVNDFAVKPLIESTFEILFTKSDFIIICRFSADTIDGNIQMSLKSCRSVLGLHRMPSTAVCAINEDKYLLTSLDGRLIEVEIREDLTENQKEVTLDCVNSSSMCSHGVHSSPNGVLSVLVQSLSPLYDHLVVREPVQVVVFANISFDSLSNSLNDKFLSKTSIQRSATFEDCFDYLDCIRSYLSNSIYSVFGTSLLSSVDNQNLINDCNHLLTLRIIRFIARNYISNNIKNNTNSDSDVHKRIESMARLSEDKILGLHIQEIYRKVVSDLETLTKSQLISLKNIDLWHSKRFSLPLIPDNSIDLSAVQEVCPICEEPIDLVSKSYGQCSQSHRFRRCVNSLVLCDLAKHKYEKCFRCHKSIVICPSIWDNSSICLYCG